MVNKLNNKSYYGQITNDVDENASNAYLFPHTILEVASLLHFQHKRESLEALRHLRFKKEKEKKFIA